MRFVVDESTGIAVIEYLRSQDHDVLAVAETMPRAADVDILSRATREGRILVTNDKDFGELVYRRAQAHHGVVLLRLRDETPANRVRVIKTVLELYAGRLEGRVTIATERGVRIRPTPYTRLPGNSR